MFKNRKNLKINKKGISTMVESAGMFFIIAMIMGLVVQVSMWSLAQITVKGAAYEAARGGAKVGTDQCISRATIIAKQYGNNLGFWAPIVSVSSGQQIIVTVKQKVPIIGKMFPGITVQAVSKEIIEEIA